jgi:hypothetical protein
LITPHGLWGKKTEKAKGKSKKAKVKRKTEG